MGQAAAENSLVCSGEFKGAMLIGLDLGLDMVGNTCLPCAFLVVALLAFSFCWPSLPCLPGLDWWGCMLGWFLLPWPFLMGMALAIALKVLC